MTRAFMSRRTGAASLERYSMAGIVIVGAWQAWVYKFKAYGDDAVSYLDLSDSVVAGHIGGVVSGHWSPLYPLLVGLVRAVTHPTPEWEFASLKIVNVALLVFALLAFRFFLRQFIGWQAAAAGADATASRTPTEWQWTAIGYALFGWAALFGIHVVANTPDLGVLGFVLIGLGIVLRIRRESDAPLLWFAVLGGTLGVGYLCKTILMPMAVILVPLACLGARGLPRRVAAAAVAGAALLIVAGPFIWSVSSRMHTFTIGESGRLNYLWYVEPHIPDHNWVGPAPGGRMPDHPMRQISTEPRAYEFDGSAVGGTYPPWTDPAYWYAGISAHFDARRLALRVIRNTVTFWQQVGLLAIGGWATLVIVGGAAAGTWRRLLRASVLIVPALAGFVMYAEVTDFTLKFDMRYVAPFVVPLVFGLLSSIRVVPSMTRAYTGAVFVAVLVFGQALAARARDDIRILTATGNDSWIVAEGLRDAGLREGDKVAHLGDRGYYWARVLRLRIIAEIPEADAWWAASPDVRRQLAERLRALGVQALVQRPGLPLPPGETEWRSIAPGAYVLMLK